MTAKLLPTKTDIKIQRQFIPAKTDNKIQKYNNKKARNLYGLGFLNGGGGGIRTHGTLQTFDSFQDCSNQPLWHSSRQIEL